MTSHVVRVTLRAQRLIGKRCVSTMSQELPIAVAESVRLFLFAVARRNRASLRVQRHRVTPMFQVREIG
ncbi:MULTISPECIES: hypothetical protein [Burkholderia]|uniref:hypothetical protein n=1 Tax=Burkholderia TaxID=32008 RepID=UPI001582CFF3|nr:MULTISPECIES: hypothetical protein [Burkholderia]MBN3733796.1 hypothetical protein [Burkholderia sp. Tr-20390]